MKKLRAAIFLIMLGLSIFRSDAISFSLDSIAEWGKFPRFCVNTYYWGDRFFNTYDTAYVKGTGTKFNVKFTTDSWLDSYHFTLPNKAPVWMVSDPSTSVGVYLTYLAVSAGYDINVSSLFGGVKHARSRYRFGFTCALLGVELYRETNDVGTKIKHFGEFRNLSVPFEGVKSSSWGLDLYYFFNHKKYSQAAAFNFSKLQKRSQGSFYAGLSIYSQKFNFDFAQLDNWMKNQLPHEWDHYHYYTNTTNYGLRLGYGYNWVVGKHWTICIAESPTIGLKKGYVNSQNEKYSFSMFNRAKVSAVWNHGMWFIGAIGSIDSAIVNDRKTTFVSSNLSLTSSVGYRFNLW